MNKLIQLALIILLPMNSFSQVFEELKDTGNNFKKPVVKVGAAFALQYQGINHFADSALIPLGTGINLPTANLNLDADLAPGLKVSLTTYLSSRHHVEAWVKGGYLKIDQMPFLNSDLVHSIMNYLTLKAGVMEINYGDAHFRRSDNGNVLNNYFVGNYIMDGFTTAPALEILFRHNGIIALASITSGTLKPELSGYNPTTKTYSSYDIHKELAYYWKTGYDNYIIDDLRIRITLSGFHSKKNHFGSLYNGDRTGSRYYLVMNTQNFSPDDVNPAKNHLSGNWGPGFTSKLNSIMFNAFTKFRGFEFFGLYENAKGTTAFGNVDFLFKQYSGELIFRFGSDEQFYTGVRYNNTGNDKDSRINRFQFGTGWFINRNIVIKSEYVNQQYINFITYGENAGFKGIMFETAISF